MKAPLIVIMAMSSGDRKKRWPTVCGHSRDNIVMTQIIAFMKAAISCKLLFIFYS